MKKKYFTYIVFAVIALIFVGTFVYLYRKSRPKEIEYESHYTASKTLERSTVITGKIVPRHEVNIKPQISGIISHIYKEAGEQVQEGELIAKVKVIPEMSSLSAAQSRLRLAEINLKQAQINFDRLQDLSGRIL